MLRKRNPLHCPLPLSIIALLIIPASSASRVWSETPAVPSYDSQKPAAEKELQPLPPGSSSSEKTVLDEEKAYRKFIDQGAGFSLEIPQSWSWNPIKTGDYLIVGAQGTNAYEISIIVQLIDKNLIPANSLQNFFNQTLDQFLSIPNNRLHKKGRTVKSSLDLPFFLITYPALNTKKEEVKFAHSQVLAENGSYYLWISYSAPIPVYKEYLMDFQHLINSLQLVN
jgi:hypothetical protein